MKMWLKVIVILAGVLFAAAFVCRAEIAEKEFVLNTWRDMHEGDNITLYTNELVNGMAVFAVSAPRDADNAQISFDEGTVWEDMGRLGNDFVLHYRPVNGQVMKVVFLFMTRDGGSRTRDPGVTITYSAE